MRLYQPQQQTRFYCGVDLHARSLYTHVLDHTGKTVLDRDLPANPSAFLDAVQSQGRKASAAGPRKAVWHRTGAAGRRHEPEPSRCCEKVGDVRTLVA